MYRVSPHVGFFYNYFEGKIKMKHVMKLHSTPFEMIQSGRKTIELRLHDEKRRLISIGDEIKFVSLSDPTISLNYRALLLAEYRYIKSVQEKIWKNAQNVYKIKIKDGEASSLAKRCNDFLLLEKACKNYQYGD